MPDDFIFHDREFDELMSPGGVLHNDMRRRLIKAVRRSKQLCPVDTGRLRASIIESEIERDGDDLVARIGSDVEYAPYVELGTSRMAGRAFLRRGLDAAK